MARCPVCGGVVERTSGEATRTVCPGYYRSADDLYPQRVTVPLLACTSCEWVAEPARLQLAAAARAAAATEEKFTPSDDTMRREEAARP